MNISTLQQSVLVTDVADVQVTETVAAEGGFVREIRILDEDNIVVFALQISSDVAANLKVTTPELQF